MHRLVHAELSVAVELRAQRFAVHERHDVIEEAVGLAAVEERENVRMLQVGRGTDLHQKPLGADRGSQLGAQHLPGHASIVLAIVREIDGGHAAFAQLAFEAIAVGERSNEARGSAGHGEVVGGVIGADVQSTGARRTAGHSAPARRGVGSVPRRELRSGSSARLA